jgi:hypothetical protein
MRHPEITQLALFATRDQGLWDRMTTHLHVRGCTQCQEEVESFLASAKELSGQAGQLPAGLDWDYLAAEMRANIKLGLEAGSIVDQPNGGREALGWRPTFALAACTLVILTGWFLHVSPRDSAKLALSKPPPQGISIEATQAGVELKQNGSAMTLRAPESQAVMLTVSAEGSVNARYVDSETGQVTINNVSFE